MAKISSNSCAFWVEKSEKQKYIINNAIDSSTQTRRRIRNINVLFSFSGRLRMISTIYLLLISAFTPWPNWPCIFGPFVLYVVPSCNKPNAHRSSNSLAYFIFDIILHILYLFVIYSARMIQKHLLLH